MGLFSFFTKKSNLNGPELKVDMHNHILPGLDDGAEDMDQSISLIRRFKELGYKKLIATPHIMGDFYKNTPEIINETLKNTREKLARENIDIQVEASAEYYIDEWFLEKLKEPSDLLVLGNNYLLVETSYLNRPQILEEAIFQINSLGLKPVLAHPERYSYLFNNYKEYSELHSRGMLFQININSLAGYYSKMSKKISQNLLKDNLVSFIGSDCHAERHLDALVKAKETRAYRNINPEVILNNSL